MLSRTQGGRGACVNLASTAWLVHSIGGFPLTSWLERRQMDSSLADLESSATKRRKAAARPLSTLTNPAKHTKSTKQTTTIYSQLNNENRISTNALSKVTNRTSENWTENLQLKNEQSFLRERQWFCSSVHRIFFIHKNRDFSSGVLYFRFPFFSLSIVIDNVLLFNIYKILYRKSFYLKEFFYFSKIKLY